MVTRCCGFYEGLFLKVSSLSTIMQKFRIRGCAHSINWLRDQPFEQGMIIYISTWLRPSPPPLITGWFDHMEANYWSFAPPPPHKPPKIVKIVTKRSQFRNNSWQISLGEYLGAYLGSSRVQKGTRYQKVQKQTRKSAKWSIHRDPNLKTFQWYL